MIKKSLWLGLASLFILPSMAMASGLSKPTWGGARAIGLGGAFVGVADDATAIWHNAAGMTALEGEHRFYIGADAIWGSKLEYTPFGATKETADRTIYTVPSFGYVNNSIERLSFGVGLVFPHGSGAIYDSPSINSLGNPKEGKLFSMEIIPAIAYEISPYLSLSASMRIVRMDTSVEQITTLLSASPLITDTATELDATGWDVGAAFGLMVRPADWLNLGFNFRTKLEFESDGQANLATAGPTDVTLEQTLPAIFTAGFGARIMPELLVAFQYGYEKNSQVEEIGVNSNGTPLPAIAQDYRDSHTFHAGMEYKPSEKIWFLAGYAQDFNTSIPDTSANRVIVDIAAKEYSLGLGLQLTKKLSTNATFNRRFGTRNVAVDGTNNIAPGYYDAHITTFALGLDLAI